MPTFTALSVLTAAQLNALDARIVALESFKTATDAMKLPLQASQLGETSAEVSESAGTLTNSGLTVNITTTVLNSKVIIDFSQVFAFPDTDPMDVVLLRGASVIETLVDAATCSNVRELLTVSGQAVDVPGAIGTYTYKTQFRRVSGSGTAAKAQPGGDHRSSIRVTEMRP